MSEKSENKNARPALRGIVQKKSGEEYIKIGKIALWLNTSKSKKKVPKYRGNVVIDGVKSFLSVWDNTEEGDN